VNVAARAATVSVRVAVAGTFASVAAAVVDIFEFSTVGSFVACAPVRAVGTAAVMVVHIAKELRLLHRQERAEESFGPPVVEAVMLISRTRTGTQNDMLGK
jgi:hypothetical protein